MHNTGSKSLSDITEKVRGFSSPPQGQYRLLELIRATTDAGYIGAPSVLIQLADWLKGEGGRERWMVPVDAGRGVSFTHYHIQVDVDVQNQTGVQASLILHAGTDARARTHTYKPTHTTRKTPRQSPCRTVGLK